MDLTITTPEHSEKSEMYGVVYFGTGKQLFGLCFQNLILKIITLGIYSPWAKTAFRQHVWQNLRFHNHNFAYHGTGTELFKGLLKILGLYFTFLISTALVRREFGSFAGDAWLFIFVSLFLFVLLPRVIVGALRYRLSRTSWRGIRLGLRAIDSQYHSEYLKGLLLTIVTLGMYAPVMAHRLYKLSMNAIHFGSHDFRYSGDATEEYLIYLKGILLTVITLGVYSFWFRAPTA